MMQDNQYISCGEAETYLSLFVEDELDVLRSVQLEKHLGTCESCRLLEEELSAERLWILENAIHSPALGADFGAKISDRIREEARPGRSLAARLRRAPGWPGLAAAGILLALLAAGFFNRREMRSPEGELALEIMAGAGEASSATGTSPAPAGSSLVSLVSGKKSLGRHAEPPPFCSPDSPEGYVICDPIDDPASTLPDPASLAGSEKDSNTEFVSFSPEVSPALKPIKTLSAGFNQLDMGQLFGLFARRYEKVTTPVAKPHSLDDPCLDDLNDDGKVDGGDVAYGCLLLLESKPTAPSSDPDKETEDTPDCDNREPCV
ncbi:MAG: zf-HC2 domain-containing protein [Planctomycetota bacterium]|nr:zf-HC2 domain-containing protein [Planctomycetota bacterium]